MLIHGYEGGGFFNSRTRVHFNTDDAHLKEWKNSFYDYINVSYHPKNQNFTVPIDEEQHGYMENPDGKTNTVYYDADLLDWLQFVYSGGKEQG